MAARSRRGAGTASALERFTRSVEQGEFYEALQLCRSVASRKEQAGKVDEARKLVVDAAKVMVQNGKLEEAVDIAKMTVQSAERRGEEATDASGEAVLSVAEAMPVCGERAALAGVVLEWCGKSAAAGAATQQCHTLLARTQNELGNHALASRHYVRAEAPEPHAKAVAAWAQRGYPSEEPYFVLREVLRYLTQGNLRDANEFHKAYRAARPRAEWAAPVMRFSEFLLATLQRDALPLYRKLREVYAPFLKRDPSLDKMLDEVARRFYNVQPPQNPLQGMLSALLGGGQQRGAAAAPALPGRPAAARPQLQQQRRQPQQQQQQQRASVAPDDMLDDIDL